MRASRIGQSQPSLNKAINTIFLTISINSMSTLKIKKLTTTSFQGIDKTKPVVLDLTQYSPNQKIAVAIGDMGTGKTSWLNSILFGFGQEFGFKLENLVSLKDGVLNGGNEFELDGKQYRVKYSSTAKSTKFTLERLFRDADSPDAPGKWIPEGEPKEMLKKLVGHVATSPMFLKNKKGADQVDWLYSILNVPQEVKEQEEKLKAALKSASASRTDANKTYEQIKSALAQDELYSQWEVNEKRYAEEKSIETEKENLRKAYQKKERYLKAQAEVDNITYQVDLKEQRIKKLEDELVALKKEKQELLEVQYKGNKFLNENFESVLEYEDVYNTFTEINSYVFGRDKWLSVVQKKKEMDEYETVVQNLDVKKDHLRASIKELVTKVLPPIPGLEVETEESIDGGKAVGIYVDGKTPAQLSESELYDFYFQVCISQGSNMVFVENLSVLGSKAIDTINMLAEKGVYVFATLMDRRAKVNRLEMVEKIEN